MGHTRVVAGRRRIREALRRDYAGYARGDVYTPRHALEAPLLIVVDTSAMALRERENIEEDYRELLMLPEASGFARRVYGVDYHVAAYASAHLSRAVLYVAAFSCRLLQEEYMKQDTRYNITRI